ncbi:hypothetical protein K474DRAFT_1324024 [Panus rudis PR-1116 ss-1]|nr:hypothetical protein K474DRAFT_1324024 [Panus rudis PR-1116 ss-1]
MSHSIIILTSTESVDPEVASNCLLEDATIALTVTTSSNSQNAVVVTPVVWKVLRFNANRAKQEKVFLDVTRRIARVTFGSLSNSDAQELVIPFDSGAGLGPNQTIVFSGGRWTSSSLFGAPSEASFAINEETEPVTFSIGTRLNGRFEPMVLLPSLGEKEGVLFPYPYVLKAYLVPKSRTCVVGQILPPDVMELLFHGEPSLDIRDLDADVAYRFYTAPDGVPVLGRAILRTLVCRDTNFPDDSD